MSEHNHPATYFQRPGEKNSQRTLELVRGRIEALGIEKVLVATTVGDTAVQAAQMLKDYEVIAVTHSTGFKEPNTQELTVENRQAIEAASAHILTSQHAFGGVNRAVRKKWGTFMTDEIIAQTLRLFSEGMKVVVEIAIMAADAGLVRTDEVVMCIAGTGRGADTAVIIQPANAQSFFDLKILDIVCMPAPGHPAFPS